MTEGPYRAGILVVCESLPVWERALPPEHRLAAVRDWPDRGYEQWLVEGPSLPEVPASGFPQEVMLLVTQERPEAGGVRLTACWHHAADRPWVVGDWPDVAAFQSWWERSV